MRKTLITLLALMLTLCFAAVAQAAPKVNYDGRDLIFDVPPVNENGTVLVPLRSVFEAMGARVDWDGETRTVISKKGGTTIRLTIGQRTAYVNSAPVNLNVPGVIIRGNTLVPLRFISEAFGAYVTWDGLTQTVIIRSPGQPVGKLYKTIDFTEISPGEAPAEIEKWVERSKKYQLAQSKTLNNKTYLLVTRGEKNTGGYGVYINKVEDRGDEVVVSVRYTEPNGMVIQAVTYPFALVKIPRVDKPIRFAGEYSQTGRTLPVDNDSQSIINSTGNIKLYKPGWGKTEIKVSGIAKDYGATLTYQVKNYYGKVIRYGDLAANYGYDEWVPFTINVPRADFGGGNKITVSITRATGNGSKETINLSLYNS